MQEFWSRLSGAGTNLLQHKFTLISAGLTSLTIRQLFSSDHESLLALAIMQAMIAFASVVLFRRFYNLSKISNNQMASMLFAGEMILLGFLCFNGFIQTLFMIGHMDTFYSQYIWQPAKFTLIAAMVTSLLISWNIVAINRTARSIFFYLALGPILAILMFAGLVTIIRLL